MPFMNECFNYSELLLPDEGERKFSMAHILKGPFAREVKDMKVPSGWKVISKMPFAVKSNGAGLPPAKGTFQSRKQN